MMFINQFMYEALLKPCCSVNDHMVSSVWFTSINCRISGDLATFYIFYGASFDSVPDLVYYESKYTINDQNPDRLSIDDIKDEL